MKTKMLRGLMIWFVMGLVAGVAFGEQGILVVQVSDTANRPLQGIVIGTGGDGSMERTDSHGKARVLLAEGTQVGVSVTLQLGSQQVEPGEEWVFRSPNAGRTTVPSFENESDNFILVVLENRNDYVSAIVDKLVESRTAELRAREDDLRDQNRALTQVVQDLIDRRDQPDAPAGIAEALEQLAAGETAAAESIFSEILGRKSSEAAAAKKEAAAAARHLGALAFLSDTEQAMGYYRQAVELDPEEPRGWNQLGHLLSRTGELAESEGAYREVLTLGNSQSDPSVIAAATGNLGLIYRTRGDLDQLDEEAGTTLWAGTTLAPLSAVAPLSHRTTLWQGGLSECLS